VRQQTAGLKRPAVFVWCALSGSGAAWERVHEDEALRHPGRAAAQRHALDPIDQHLGRAFHREVKGFAAPEPFGAGQPQRIGIEPPGFAEIGDIDLDESKPELVPGPCRWRP